MIFFGADCTPKDARPRAKITARDNLFTILMLMLLIVVEAKIWKSGHAVRISRLVIICSNIRFGAKIRKDQSSWILQSARMKFVLTIIVMMIVTFRRDSFCFEVNLWHREQQVRRCFRLWLKVLFALIMTGKLQQTSRLSILSKYLNVFQDQPR